MLTKSAYSYSTFDYLWCFHQVRWSRVSARGLKSYCSCRLDLQGDLFWSSFCVRRGVLGEQALAHHNSPRFETAGMSWAGIWLCWFLVSSFISFKKSRKRWLRLVLEPICFSHCSHDKTATLVQVCEREVAPILLKLTGVPRSSGFWICLTTELLAWGKVFLAAASRLSGFLRITLFASCGKDPGQLSWSGLSLSFPPWGKGLITCRLAMFSLCGKVKGSCTNSDV